MMSGDDATIFEKEITGIKVLNSSLALIHSDHTDCLWDIFALIPVNCAFKPGSSASVFIE